MSETGRLLRIFLELAALDSPSLNERAAADYVIRTLTEAGIPVKEDDAAISINGDTGNLIVNLPGNVSGKPILFAAHLDTVEPGRGVEPVIKDGYVVSAGATVLGADDKAGVAVIIELLLRLVGGDLPYADITAIFTVAEEVGLIGAQALDYSDWQADLGFVFDDGGPVGRITTQAPYQDHFSCKFIGQAAHAGLEPEAGRSAIRAAAAAVTQMSLGRLDDETTANIGTVRGGTAINVVPAEAEISGEARSHSVDKLTTQIKHMTEACAVAAKATGVEYGVTIRRLYEGFDLAANHAAVARARVAVKEAGLTPMLGKSGGGSDTNIFNAHGIAAVNIGVGYEKVHTPDERLPVSALNEALDVAMRLAAPQKSDNGAGQ